MAQIYLEAAESQPDKQEKRIDRGRRQKTRRVRERDAAKEVARLELQLAQQRVAVLQAQFAEGKLNLRDMERARLEENESGWLIWTLISRSNRRSWNC